MTTPGHTTLDFSGNTFPSALAFVSAYVEVACFIGLFGLFTSFVTGDIILIGVELVEESPDILTKILILPVFILSCALWSWLLRNMPRPSPTAIRAALLTQATLLVITVLLAGMLAPLDGSDALQTMAVAVPAVLACSLQMIMMRHQIISHPHTTIMTGNIGQLALAIASFYTGRPPGTPDTASEMTTPQHNSIRHQLIIILGFLIGAICGGTAFGLFGFTSLSVPIVVLVVYAAVGHIRTAGKPQASTEDKT